MITPYIPARDADFETWLLTFSTTAAASPVVYALSGGEVVAIQAAYTDWNAAWTLASDPATRTSATVAAKDAARQQAESTVRPLAVRISLNAAISEEAKVAIGVRVRQTTPTPVPPPSTQPVLSLVNAIPGVQRIQSRDASTPSSKAKPPGAIAMEVWVATGTVPAIDPAQAVYVKQVTKSPFPLTTTVDQRGKTLTIFGRWVTRSGPQGISQVGPWSDPLITTGL